MNPVLHLPGRAAGSVLPRSSIKMVTSPAIPGVGGYSKNYHAQARPLNTSATTAAATTTTKSGLGLQSSSVLSLRPHHPTSSAVTSVRYFFAPSSASSATTTSPSSSPASISSANAPLDWNSFFKLRASRRRYSLASSIVTSLFTTGFGVQFLATTDIDALGGAIGGLDPFIVIGLATAACGAVGWLTGPVLGNGVWGLVNRRFKAAFARKDKELYHRIQRFRVDPSANSFSNPVPDYYGEKIGSVQGYRQWLKDQRVYNRKKRSFV